jgi:excisionase family DNA binding protein
VPDERDRADTISTEEAAEILGVTGRHVRRLVDRGYLRAFRLTPTSPRQLSRSDVEGFLARAQQAAAA